MQRPADRPFLEALVRTENGPTKVRDLMDQGMADRDLAETVISENLLREFKALLDGDDPALPEDRPERG